MEDPNFDMMQGLTDQKKLLEIKKERINNLLQTIEETVSIVKGGETMNINNLFQSFSNEQMDAYTSEAKKRWGQTKAYKQSVERTKHWTKEDYRRLAQEGKIFTQQLADAMEKDIKSQDVQKLIAQHHKGIETFYDCSYEMYRGLADMYVADPRFRNSAGKPRRSWLSTSVVR